VCLIVFAWNAHPEYKLILAANRDEFHSRPSQAAHWWADVPGVLGGRDLRAGGTWLATSRSGRFATVTNYREQQPTPSGARSRGEIVTDVISGERDPGSYVHAFAGEAYAGVSVLAGDSDNIYYASNRGDAAVTLGAGVYGLSNASLDTPWTKLVRTKEALAALIAADDVSTAALLSLLADKTLAAGSDVDDRELPFTLARALTAPFIVSETYGTRCSTTLMIANDGRTRLRERRFDPQGVARGDSNFSFNHG
jgi:uncharacterized protein with NRDE domain